MPMTSRLPLPEPEAMTPRQRAIHDSIIASRGNLDGPFLAWLHSPGLAEPAQRLGAFCRYGTSLALPESELLILVVAAHFRCEAEAQIHEPIAAAAGVAPEAIAAVARGERPTFGAGESCAARLHDLAVELLRTQRIGPERLEAARAELGEQLLVEAVGLVGYYALVALTLNAFGMRAQAPEPAGADRSDRLPDS